MNLNKNLTSLLILIISSTLTSIITINQLSAYYHRDYEIEPVVCWTNHDTCAQQLGLGWKCKVASTGAITDELKGVQGYCREICWNC